MSVGIGTDITATQPAKLAVFFVFTPLPTLFTTPNLENYIPAYYSTILFILRI